MSFCGRRASTSTVAVDQGHGSSDTRNGWNPHAARVEGFGELGMLVHRWATAQNTDPLAERAAEFAQAMANCGADTWGDVRELT